MANPRNPLRWNTHRSERRAASGGALPSKPTCATRNHQEPIRIIPQNTRKGCFIPQNTLLTRGQTTEFIETIHPLDFTRSFSPCYFHQRIFTHLFSPKKWVKRNNYTVSVGKMHIHPQSVKMAFSQCARVRR